MRAGRENGQAPPPVGHGRTRRPVRQWWSAPFRELITPLDAYLPTEALAADHPNAILTVVLPGVRCLSPVGAAAPRPRPGGGCTPTYAAEPTPSWCLRPDATAGRRCRSPDRRGGVAGRAGLLRLPTPPPDAPVPGAGHPPRRRLRTGLERPCRRVTERPAPPSRPEGPNGTGQDDGDGARRERCGGDDDAGRSVLLLAGYGTDQRRLHPLRDALHAAGVDARVWPYRPVGTVAALAAALGDQMSTASMLTGSTSSGTRSAGS